MKVEFYTANKTYGKQALVGDVLDAVSVIMAEMKAIVEKHSELRKGENKLQLRVVGGMGLILKDETTMLQQAIGHQNVS